VIGRPGLALVFGAAVLAAGPGGAAGQSARLWRPEERVLVSAFHELGAVATDLRRVYAASPAGLEIYDFVARRWEPPSTAEDGYPAGETPTALAYDRFLDALWMGTASGNLYRFRPRSGEWDRVGAVAGGPVLRLVVPRDPREGDVFLATPAGWARLRRGSLFAEAVPEGGLPAEVRAAGTGPAADRLGREDPFFDALRGTLTLDDRLRRWPIADVAPADRPGRFWIATQGGNLLLYDGRRSAGEWLHFGLLSRGAAALATDGAGVWFGGDGRGPRRGVAYADTGLQRWAVHEAESDGAPAGYVWDILPLRDAVWFAASDGLYRYDPRGRGRAAWRRLTEADGLPASEALSLAPGQGGVWVGTRRGLAWVGDDGTARRAAGAPARRIHRLAARGDTLWIASDAGLWVLADGADPAARAAAPAPGSEAQPALRARVVDVRPAADAIYALAQDALYRLAAGAWSGPIREPGGGALGRLTALAAADGELWVAGDGGAARWDRATGLWTVFRVGGDIPEGPVRAVLPAGGHVWLATPAGALRLAWRE